MPITIKYCHCGRMLSSQDVEEGRPCKVCRIMKKLDIPQLNRKEHKPNPARDVYRERVAV